MKKRTFILGNIATLFLAALTVQAADQTTKFYAKSGSKMRIEGTSTIHDWQVEGTLIGGYLEVGANFPVEPGQAATPGRVDGHAEPFIMVRSLKSIEKDGKPYSDKMDEVMYEHLKVQQNPKISFHLTDLTLKEAAKGKDEPYLFDAKGQLTVASELDDSREQVSSQRGAVVRQAQVPAILLFVDPAHTGRQEGVLVDPKARLCVRRAAHHIRELSTDAAKRRPSPVDFQRIQMPLQSGAGFGFRT